MNYLKVVLIFCFSASSTCFAQQDSISVTYDSTVTVSLSSGRSSISRAEVDTGFTLVLSDSSARIISFFMQYAFKTDTSYGLMELFFQGNRGKRKPGYRVYYMKDPGSNFITIDHLNFERNGRRYRARFLFLPIR